MHVKSQSKRIARDIYYLFLGICMHSCNIISIHINTTVSQNILWGKISLKITIKHTRNNIPRIQQKSTAEEWNGTELII